MNNSIIIVSGLPRSGTSMIMKMLQMGGVEIITDNLRKPDIDNPEGYYEYEKVKCLERDSTWLQNMEGKAIKVISMLLYHLPGNMNYKIIFVQRRMQEILDSQRKMLERLGRNQDGIDDAVLAQKFNNHLEKIASWIKDQKNIKCLYINYSQVLKDPLKYSILIHGFLDRPLDVKAMAAVADQTLYRNRSVEF
jgi:hypothetical protein